MAAPLYIRADADPVMGTGHVMRCLALGQEWARMGGSVVFLGHMAVPSLVERIAAEGFSWLPLHDIVSGTDSEPAAVRRWLAAGKRGWLALDGYHFGSDYQRVVRESGQRLLVIDDNALLPEYCCDIVLNQNIHAPELFYPVLGGAGLLLGPRYALLRREFRQGAARESQPETAKKVLVTMGGADPRNITAVILKALAGSGLDGLEVLAVAGPANPHRPELQTLAAAMPFRCEIIQAGKEMPGLMGWADAAITAAGTTTYELAAMGVPFLAVVIAENQRRNAEGFAAHGIAEILELFESAGQLLPAARIGRFLCDGLARQAGAQAGRRLVDGRGAGRVVTAMQARDVRLRPVRWEDRDLLLRWANDSETRRNSFCGETITRAGHEGWLTARLADAGCVMYLARNGSDVPLGVARFEVTGEKALISVGIDPAFRHRGVGSCVIRAACDRVLADRGLATVRALVKADNRASLGAFARAGFTFVADTERSGVPAVFLQYAREQGHG